MKRIRILAALVIIVFLIVELGDAARGWNEAGESKSFAFPIELSLKMHGETGLDSVFCPQLNKYAPCQVEKVSVDLVSAGAKVSGWYTAISILCLFAAFFMVYGFYCLIKMVIIVTRGEVFTRKNVFRIRCFVYGVILFSICAEIGSWLQYTEAASLVQFTGYEVESYTLKGAWLYSIIMALLTEIFAVGVKLKEEQDLTV